MDAPQPLRLSAPDPQGAFPFAEPGSQRALAIPLDDLNTWRGRSDVVRNPGYMAVRYDQTDDPRYHALLDLARARDQAPGMCLFTLWAIAGHALTLPIPGVLAMGGRPLQLAHVWARWWIPDAWWPQHEAAARLIITAGWLCLADLTDSDLLAAYGKIRKESRAHARARAPVDVDADVDQIKTETSASTEDNSQERLLHGDDPHRAKAELTFMVARLRNKHGKPPYPSSAGDMIDLTAATRQACTSSRMPELIALLKKTAAWADSGAAFRVVLRKGGFIP